MDPNKKPLIVLLHWLGGSARTWDAVVPILQARGIDVLALDLPGFGDAASVQGYSVEAMATYVAARLREARGESEQKWMIAGHSMGGKVGSVVAWMSAHGAEGLAGLRGVISVSGSPLSPEPMEDSKREEMLASLGESSGDAEEDMKHARKFVEDNVGVPALSDAVMEATVRDVLRMNRAAFRAWLESGSREDWSERVGVLPLPVLAIGGAKEPQLGPKAQRELVLPHFVRGEVYALEGSGHLGPLERPQEVAALILRFVHDEGLQHESELSEAFRALIASDKTSPQTRTLLLQRIERPASARLLSQAPFTTLCTLVEAVVPDAGFDLATRMDAKLAATSAGAKGDGFRYELLPPAPEAWTRGLATLEAAAMHEYDVSFSALTPEQVNTLLEKMRAGALHRSVKDALVGDFFNAEEMQAWFADVRGELVRLYLADPRGMEHVGFKGFADEEGFAQIQLGEREVFER